MRTAVATLGRIACTCALAWFGACASSRPPQDAPRAAAADEFGFDAAGVPWALRPALDELSVALQARDDELATQLLERLRPQLANSPLAERLEAWSRLVEGRAWTRALAPRLECRASEGAATPRQTLWLCVNNDAAEALRLDCAPPRLVRTSTWIDERGELARNQEVRRLSGFERLDIAAQAETRLPIGEFEPRAGRSLAVREHFALEWTAGMLTRDGRAAPLDRARGATCDYVGLAGFLPRAAVEPAELARYAQGDEVRLEPLVERAVRIAPARYDEALDLLADASERCSLRRIEELAPALRWLGRDPSLGASALGWKEWLRARHNRASTRDASPLDLPSAASAPPTSGSGLSLP